MFTYRYPHPAVTADVVALSPINDELYALLIRRLMEPSKGRWALPGGFMDIDETLESAAARELREETGLVAVHLRQVGVFSTIDRDPRERVISAAFYTIVSPADTGVQAADDASDARWCPVNARPDLAFDHEDILAMAIQRLRSDLTDPDIYTEMLPAGMPAEKLAAAIGPKP